MEYSIPVEADIVEVVKCLHLNRLVGTPGMQVKHLHQCLREATQEEDPDIANWEKVVAIVQVGFKEGFLAEACAW